MDNGTDENQRGSDDPDCVHEALGGRAAEQVREAVLNIVEVAEQGREGEQEHSHGDEYGADTAERRRERRLDERRARQILRRRNAGAQRH